MWPWLGQSAYEKLRSRHGLNRAEWLVLSSLADEPQCFAAAAKVAVARSLCESLGEASIDECKAAVAACIQKQYAFVIDDTSLAFIHDLLVREPGIGPIEPIPEFGAVDLTPRGGELYLVVEREFAERPPREEREFERVITTASSARYFLSEDAALKTVAELRRESRTVSVLGPRLTKPFCSRWWELHPAAYRIEVVRREDDTSFGQ